MNRFTYIYIDFIHEVRPGVHKLEGYLGGKAIDLEKIRLCVNNIETDIEFVERIQSQDGLEQQAPIAGSTFEAVIEIDSSIKTEVQFIYKDSQLCIRTNKFTGLSSLGMSYVVKDQTTVIKEDGKLFYAATNPGLIDVLESRFRRQILIDWRYEYLRQKIKHANPLLPKLITILKSILMAVETAWNVPYSLRLRKQYFAAQKNQQKPIWIVSDRVMSAGDNGEAFFRYLMGRDDMPARVYFALSKQSADFERLSAIGPVLEYGSRRHKLMHLQADKIISSQADVEITNPFRRQFDHFADLMNFDFVFLQHGIIRHDLSGWLNRFNKNIALFVTTAQPEYESLLKNAYYYREDQIVMSGLPRYDMLESNPQNKIILAPTYRKYLIRMKTNKNGLRKYDQGFKKSEYYKFYADLMSDRRLHAAMNKHGVTAEFYIHPVFAAQYSDFSSNDHFQIMKFPYNYRRALEEGSLLVSDYSSITFDFAYLRKPILYAQTDYAEFYRGHTSGKPTFFKDPEDGFGEVCYDSQSLIDAIIRQIEDGFELKAKYRHRINNFFAYNDKRNAKRLYDAMLDR